MSAVPDRAYERDVAEMRAWEALLGGRLREASKPPPVPLPSSRVRAEQRREIERSLTEEQRQRLADEERARNALARMMRERS